MAKDPVAKKDLDKKQIITVVALFAVLLVAVYFFFLRGGGDEPADLGPVPVVQATETPGGLGDPGATPDPGETPDPEETGDPDGGPSDPPTNSLRDPFEPPPGAGEATGNPFEEPVTPSTEETPAPEPTPEATPTP